MREYILEMPHSEPLRWIGQRATEVRPNHEYTPRDMGATVQAIFTLMEEARNTHLTIGDLEYRITTAEQYIHKVPVVISIRARNPDLARYQIEDHMYDLPEIEDWKFT